MSGRKGASGGRAQDGPGVPDHVLTPLILSVAVVSDQVDVLMEARDLATRRRVAEQIEERLFAIASELCAVRLWLAVVCLRASDPPSGLELRRIPPRAAGDPS